jgi:hypothetical protein
LNQAMDSILIHKMFANPQQIRDFLASSELSEVYTSDFEDDETMWVNWCQPEYKEAKGKWEQSMKDKFHQDNRR